MCRAARCVPSMTPFRLTPITAVEVGEVVLDEAVELAADPGVVEHDVEAAELLDREVDRCLHVVGVAHVDPLERDRVAELRRQLLAPTLVDVGDHDLRAPSATNRSTAARPRPPAPPVTIATFSLSSPMVTDPFRSSGPGTGARRAR